MWGEGEAGRGPVCLLCVDMGLLIAIWRSTSFLLGILQHREGEWWVAFCTVTSLLLLVLFLGQTNGWVDGWRDGRYPGPDSRGGSDWGRNDDIVKG